MTAATSIAESEPLLRARVRIPQAVVYRSFAKETVVLNLDTGIYHGANPNGGRMLDALDKVGLVHQSARILARDYDSPLEEIQADLCRFCEALIEHGLLVVEPS